MGGNTVTIRVEGAGSYLIQTVTNYYNKSYQRTYDGGGQGWYDWVRIC